MNIKCPQCDTLYDVSEEIANSGAQVQCAKCNDIFAATPAPEPETALELAPEPTPQTGLEPAGDPLPEPVAQAVSDADGSSDLLNEDEKTFFAGLVEKLSDEEDIEPAQDSAPEQELDAFEATPVPEASEAPAAELESDDIGWVEDEADEQPADEMPIEEPAELPAEEPVVVPSPDPMTEDDLFADVDLQTEPEPEKIIALTVPVEEVTPEKSVGFSKLPKLPQLSREHIGWGALAASITFVIVAATTFRVPIVKALPGMAGLYEKAGYPVNIRGLEFLGLSHQWMDQGGRMRLVVRGEIVNITNEAMPVPQILFSMLDKSGLEFFQWTEKAGPALLQPKARTRFRAQIPAPAERVRQLKIRFANR